MINGHWTTILWEEKFFYLNSDNFNFHNKLEGVLCIKPPFAEITLSDGFWNNLNQNFNKMFDYAEEEEIETNEILKFVYEIKNFADRNYNIEGMYEIIVGEELHPDKQLVKEKILYRELRQNINNLCDFLLDS